ncbi:MAG TPA: hypothetical protein VFJ59_03950 [Pseudolabrys sp.]|nr:hypothetical protein [Pseudolabrys sp.]
MKQAEIAAHSSGRKGGDSRVFDVPLIGVLQMIATATVLKALILKSFNLFSIVTAVIASQDTAITWEQIAKSYRFELAASVMFNKK